MTYEQAISELQALGFELHAPQREFELDSIRTVLATLGNPQTRFRSVLIAGTNGKGSTAATLASILRAAGYRAALYTSPHLLRVNERIQVNGEDISDAAFAAAYERVEREIRRLLASGGLRWHLSYFEMLTAMAFCHFAENQVAIAVLEAGLGGRVDATNVVEPCLSVITDISLDHQEFLGSTRGEIAREKAGIMRPGRPIVTLPQHEEVDLVLEQVITDLGARAVTALPFLSTAPAASSRRDRPGNRYAVNVAGWSVQVDSPLVGIHQRRNLALALAAADQLRAEGMSITSRQMEQGVNETRWPGRCEYYPASATRPAVLLDGAHNPAGAVVLRAAIEEYFAGRAITLVFGVARDKAIRELADLLFPLARNVIVTQAGNPRAAAPAEIRAATRHMRVDLQEAAEVESALQLACELTGMGKDLSPGFEPAEGLIVVAGSLYLVGKVLGWLKGG